MNIFKRAVSIGIGGVFGVVAFISGLRWIAQMRPGSKATVSPKPRKPKHRKKTD